MTSNGMKGIMSVLAVFVVCIMMVSMLQQRNLSEPTAASHKIVSRPAQSVMQKHSDVKSFPARIPALHKPMQVQSHNSADHSTSIGSIAQKLGVVKQFLPEKSVLGKRPCGDHLENNKHFVDRDFWRSITSEQMLKYSDGIKRFQSNGLPQIDYDAFAFEGRGVVYTVGTSTFLRALTSIKILKLHLESELPVQVWYMLGELDVGQIEQLTDLGVQPMELLAEQKEHPLLKEYHAGHAYGQNRNYHIKSLVLILCPFKEILYLDSDNLPLRDPGILFDTEEYKSKGALFFKDFWKFPVDNPIWQITGQHCEDEWEFETGQIVLDKQRSWKPLILSLYLQQQHEFYFRIILGDKDTFRMAWKIMNQPYHVINRPLAIAGRVRQSRFCGHTMLQFAPDDEIMFAHTSAMKSTHAIRWGITWETIKYLEETGIEQISDTVATASYPIAVEYQGGVVKSVDQGGVGQETMPNPCLDWSVTPLNLTTVPGAGLDSYKVVQEAFHTYADGRFDWFESKFFEFGGQGPEQDGGTCGFGNVGNGQCQDQSLCCSSFGYCHNSIDHCGVSCVGGPCFKDRELPAIIESNFEYCGNGNVGYGICQDPNDCCSVWGWCSTQTEHCKADVCIHGPCLK